MATDSDERAFRSNLRKDVGNRDRRRVYEEGYSNGNSAKYSHLTNEKPESAVSITVRTPVTSSVTRRLHGMNINDECHDNGNGHERDEKNESSPVMNSLQIDNPYMNDDNEAEDEGEKKEEEQVKRKIKKSRSAHKRKERKNLREKRRSTGVVIMPGQPVGFTS